MGSDAALHRLVHVLRGDATDYDPLLDAVGDAQLVLIGEATHGTHEHYRERAEITRRLITDKGFNVVAVEADWPDAYEIDRYVCAPPPHEDAVDAFFRFQRFPTWMWRNADVLDFVGWLRDHDEQNRDSQVHFYGLDLYSMYGSVAAVIAFLDRRDPAAARRARERYACLAPFEDDAQRYGYEAALGMSRSCEAEVVEQLVELQRRRNGEDTFIAEQNARVVKNAEAYYRSMLHGSVASWNLRDEHMFETLTAIERHVARAKVVLWAHNSHLGDARATSMGRAGELNLGQLVRQHAGPGAVLIGQTTHHGSVTAAPEWGGPAERRRIRPALEGSYEAFFHATGVPRFLLNLRDDPRQRAAVPREALERAIGVVYLPETERQSHYFHANLSEQFDLVLHYDETRAVEPLERWAEAPAREPPETFPTGM